MHGIGGRGDEIEAFVEGPRLIILGPARRLRRRGAATARAIGIRAEARKGKADAGN
jgi:hypothetical protein